MESKIPESEKNLMEEVGPLFSKIYPELPYEVIHNLLREF